MLLTIEIRQSVQLVRHRDGVELTQPVLECEDGSAPDAPVVLAQFDLRSHIRQGRFDPLNGEAPRTPEAPPDESRIVGSAAGTAGQDPGQGAPDDEPHEAPSHRRRPERSEEFDEPDEAVLVRRALSNPRRFLRQLFEASTHGSPVDIALSREFPHGLGRVDLTADTAELEVRASLRLRTRASSRLKSAYLARGQRSRPALSQITFDVRGRLLADGGIDGLRIRGFLRDVPRLDGPERLVLDRLRRSVERIAASAASHDEQCARLIRLLRRPAAEHPELPVLLLKEVCDRFEALDVRIGEERRRQDRESKPKTTLTLADILDAPDHGGPEEPEQPTTGTLPNLQWINEHRARLQLGDPNGPASTRASSELARLSALIPALISVVGTT